MFWKRRTKNPPALRDWQSTERFESSWSARIERMARYLDSTDELVLDIGCGPMWLRQYLPAGLRYQGLDYTNRGNDCIVCDLNRDRLPTTSASAFFISGCLEYLDNPERLITDVSERARKCILSYCCLDDFPDIKLRTMKGWRNHVTRDELLQMFDRHNMQAIAFDMTESQNSIFVFVPK